MKNFILIFILLLSSFAYSVSDTVTVKYGKSLPTITFVSGDQTICAGEQVDIVINLTSGPVWDFTYRDSTHAGAVTFHTETTNDSSFVITVYPMETTTYMLNSVSNSSCSGSVIYGPPPSSGSVTIYVKSVPELTISNVEQALCHGGNTGSATVNVVAGGVPPYVFGWDGGAWQQATDPYLSAGLHYVTVTDDNGCSSIDSITIGEPAVLEISGTFVTDVNCGGTNSGAITVMPIGGTPNYHYNWDNGDTTQSILGLTIGDYTVTVTDDNGCQTISNPAITVTGLQAPSAIIEQNDIVDVTCYGGNTGEATVHATGGTNTYSYLWSNGQTVQHATGLSAGTYTVTVTDGNGCTDSFSATIVEPSELNVSFSSTNVSCDGLSLGSAYANVTGGTAPYSYDWDGGNSNIFSISDLGVGAHSVVIVDANGCYPAGYNSNVFTISQDPMPTVTLSASNSGVSCNGDAVDLIAVGAGGGVYDYHWSTGQVDSVITVNPVVTTTYYVTVTNSYGSQCSVVDSIEVTVAVMPVLTFLPDLYQCENVAQVNLAADVTVTGGSFTGLYYSGPGVNVTTGVLDLSGLIAGDIYTYVVEGQLNGCTVKDSADIEIRTLPNVQLDLTPSEVCLDAGEVQLFGESPVGGYFVGSGVDSTGLFNTNLVGSGYTSIQYFYTDVYGCSNYAQSDLNVVAPQTLSINLPSTEFCNGEGIIDVMMSQSGGVAMLYGDGISSNGITLANDGNYVFYLDVSNLDGNYDLVYTLTTAACGGTDTVYFDVHETPDVYIAFPGADINNLSDTVDYVMDFTLGATVTIDGQILVGNLFSGPVWQAGQHEIVATVDNGYCLGKDSVTVFVHGADGIQELNIASLISVFPNPVSDILHIEMGDVDVSDVQIINSMGQVVYYNEINLSDMSIDVSEFVSGIYFVRFITDDGSVSDPFKIIKQ